VSQVAVGLQNRLYVLGAGSSGWGQIAQIDATSGASVGPNVPVSVYSGGIQISPDRSTLYYATYGLSPGSLYRINVFTTTPTVTWTNGSDIGENGQDLVLSHDGSMVSYVCGYGYQGYRIPNFQTSNMSLLGIFDTGAYPNALAFSPDDSLAYALHTLYPSAVDVYGTETYKLLGQFGIADRSSLMATDQSGRDLFVSFNGTYNNVTNTIVYATGTPEPSGLVLLVAGAAGLRAYGRRWRRQTV
jgi:DNA-binding beta-propeller fold protein YncE